MSSLNDEDMPVLHPAVDVPNQLAIMDAGSPRRKRLTRKVRKRPSSILELDGECKDDGEDGGDDDKDGGADDKDGGECAEDDGRQQRVLKRPRAAPLVF